MRDPLLTARGKSPENNARPRTENDTVAMGKKPSSIPHFCHGLLRHYSHEAETAGKIRLLGIKGRPLPDAESTVYKVAATVDP